MAAAALAVLGGPAALAADAQRPAALAADAGMRAIPVQYGGPGMGGPGDDGPPDSGPGRARREGGPLGPFKTYHGFRIDLGAGDGGMGGGLGEVERQIDIVDRSGLRPAMLNRFRAVPIRISASPWGGGGHYSGGAEVTVGMLRPGDDRPVLLHEYMHVLEFRTFPGGAHNPTVGRYYDEARAEGLYPPESYMMSNPAEFFAVTASCYLNGTVARDPYTRAAIRERQPDYYAYLARIFGPRGGTASLR